ncbi:UNVERIFIED_CONTAM: hypothetical protein FKN15_033053 [Acipenser sinensis]
MEVSVAAQIQSINFMTLQILDGTQEAAGLHVERDGNFPQVHVTVNSENQEGGAIEGSGENIPSEDTSSEDTSSESDSDSSSSTSPCLMLSEADDDDFMGPGKGRKPQPLKTKDEILPEELPSVEDETIILPEDVEIKQIGFVSSIIEQLGMVDGGTATNTVTGDQLYSLPTAAGPDDVTDLCPGEAVLEYTVLYVTMLML